MKMLLMGDYEILSTEDETKWQLNNRLNPSYPQTFDNLDDLLRYIKLEIEDVEIEE